MAIEISHAIQLESNITLIVFFFVASFSINFKANLHLDEKYFYLFLFLSVVVIHY